MDCSISRRRLPKRFTVFLCGLVTLLSAHATDFRGIQFLSFTNVSSFETSAGPEAGQTMFVSKELSTPIQWNELIMSWNAEAPKRSRMKFEVRAWQGDEPTRFYTMGIWSGDPTVSPRKSISAQKDEAGDVSTDTLILKKSANKVQFRIIIGGEGKPLINFVGLCLTDTRVKPDPLEPNRQAWGKTIPVPERSQMAYRNGGVLCSPTTVSMLMTYWSAKLNRSDLDRDVPEVTKEGYDENWRGAGNWAFNMAYPGSFPGMRAYVTRMSDVSELEDWIAAGLPVGLSVCYDRLRGKGPGPNGHLVVCVGFTDDGDVIINDPGTLRHVRKTFPRKNLISAWANSKNAVYLIYPESATLPKDRFHHWESE